MLLLAALAALPGAGAVMKGMCYGPMPLKTIGEFFPVDDFMSEASKPLWGDRGRGDLALMRRMGANAVRLYGNDPRQAHKAFLDSALGLGLDVIPGLSDWPFAQMEDSCSKSGYDCFEQIKESYLGNLRNGWLQADGTYHTALKQVIVMNEPELKMPHIRDPRSYTKSMITAIDGMLSAEDEMGVTGVRPNFTVTYSFAVCWKCKYTTPTRGKPALNQMVELRRAMTYPSLYDYYKPKHDLKAVYETRFTNSFNTANPSTELNDLFFNAYYEEFPTVPVFIGEFHAAQRGIDQGPDVSNILQMAGSNPLFLGINFFEFQVRYDKGGTELAFGIFGLGDRSVSKLSIAGNTYDAWCLEPVEVEASAQSLPSSVAIAFGAQAFASGELCQPDADKVPLTAAGFADIVAMGTEASRATFVTRVVRHAGGTVVNAAGLAAYARTLGSFATLEAAIAAGGASLAWASFNAVAPCRADRSADTGSVGLAIEKACADTWFNCGNLPPACSGSVWDVADYVLSVYYNQEGGSATANCYFAGAATREAQTGAAASSNCSVTRDATTTALTDEGYQAVLLRNDTSQTAAFLARVAWDRLQAVVVDAAQLEAMAAARPPSMFDILAALENAAWLCRGGLEACRPDPNALALTDSSLQLLRGFGNASLTVSFVSRVAAHFGGEVTDAAGLWEVVASAKTLELLVGVMATRPIWARWTDAKACLLDRTASEVSLGLTVEYACLHTWFNCSFLPKECTADPRDTADYVLSVYRTERGGKVLPTCLFKGALIFSQTAQSASIGDGPRCIVTADPATTPLTDEGYHAVLRQGNASKTEVFLERVVRERLKAFVFDYRELRAMATSPPASMYDITQLLKGATWLCFDGAADCKVTADKAPLTSDGFELLLGHGDAGELARFAERIVEHYGGRVFDEITFKAVAASYASFDSIIENMEERPSWAFWRPDLACRLDLYSDAASLGLTIELVCLQTWFNCSRIPTECSGDPYDTAAYVLSVFANERNGSALATCDHKGALIFSQVGGSAAAAQRGSLCLVTRDPWTTPLTDEGLQAILRQKDAGKNAAFVYRFASTRLGAVLVNETGLRQFAAGLSANTSSIYELERHLPQAVWLCLPGDATCVMDVSAVSLTEDGFRMVLAQQNATLVRLFVARVVGHYGGVVRNDTALGDLAQSSSSLEEIAAALQARPSWAQWEPTRACLANNVSDFQEYELVSLTVEHACRSMRDFDCDNIPAACGASLWDAADYALSVFQLENDGNALPTCYVNDSLIFARPRTAGGCVVTRDPWTTPLTEEGYQAVLGPGNASAVAVFIRRAIDEFFPDSVVESDAGLMGLAAQPPASLFLLVAALRKATWLCIACAADAGGDRGAGSDADLGWRPWAFAGIGAVVGASLVGAFGYVVCSRPGSARKLGSAPSAAEAPDGGQAARVGMA